MPWERYAVAADTFTITDLANEFKVTARAIRFYEDKKLLKPQRNGLQRVYSRRDRARLVLILRGKRLGFSLGEIREMLDLYDLGDGQESQLRVTLTRSRDRLKVLEHQRRDIDDAIAELRQDVTCMTDYLAMEARQRPPLAEFIAKNRLPNAAE
jgi:DNA-binding transcriptional MerR regulator